MKKIEARKNLVATKLEEIPNAKLMKVFEELVNYRSNGKLEDYSYLDSIVELIPMPCHSKDIDYEILYELSRRFYNFYNSDINLLE